MKKGEKVIVHAYVENDNGGKMIEVKSMWSNTTAWVSRRDVDNIRKLRVGDLPKDIEEWALKNDDIIGSKVNMLIMQEYYNYKENQLDKKLEEVGT